MISLRTQSKEPGSLKQKAPAILWTQGLEEVDREELGVEKY